MGSSWARGLGVELLQLQHRPQRYLFLFCLEPCFLSKSVVALVACFLKAIGFKIALDSPDPSASSEPELEAYGSGESPSMSKPMAFQWQPPLVRAWRLGVDTNARSLFLFCSEHCFLAKRAASLVACFLKASDSASSGSMEGAKSCVRFGACLCDECVTSLPCLVSPGLRLGFLSALRHRPGCPTRWSQMTYAVWREVRTDLDQWQATEAASSRGLGV